MKYFIAALIILLSVMSAVATEDPKDRYEFNKDGVVKVDGNKSGAEALFYFPDIKTGFLTDFHSISPVVMLELMDTDSIPNIIPIRIDKMPYTFDIVWDVGVAENLAFTSAGLKLLPILEPSVWAWTGYSFEDPDFVWKWGLGVSIGIKF